MGVREIRVPKVDVALLRKQAEWLAQQVNEEGARGHAEGLLNLVDSMLDIAELKNGVTRGECRVFWRDQPDFPYLKRWQDSGSNWTGDVGEALRAVGYPWDALMLGNLRQAGIDARVVKVEEAIVA